MRPTDDNLKRDGAADLDMLERFRMVRPISEEQFRERADAWTTLLFTALPAWVRRALAAEQSLACSRAEADHDLAQIGKLVAENKALGAFKGWVHAWLDEQGVPADANPEQTQRTGCRVSGRMEYLIRERDEACRVAALRVSGDPEVRNLLLYEFGTTDPDLLREAIGHLRARAAAAESSPQPLLPFGEPQ